MNKISINNAAELLAPAGNMDCLIAAVQNGADAVYFGGGLFNARRGAANFTGDSLREAIDYCHLRNVKTHITLNTLLFDNEIADALKFASKLFSLHADAVIVQDLGLASLIHEELPELVIHASTQMGIHSLGGLRYCERNGIGRAVLAREVPLNEIRRMHEASDIELEFFCHGALCMGFSGSCLYSSMAGERSGNRGTCAQPCRKNASVLNRRASSGEFALSTNDICMMDELEALQKAGICSFKIEGRMKQPEYVATVTRMYRAALDGEKPSDARSTLFEIFNRGEFSTSHIRGDSVTTGHVGCAKPSKALIAKAHESVRRDRPVRGINAELELCVGEPARLTLGSGNLSVCAEGDVCECPNTPIDGTRFAEQLKKLGGTPFFMRDCIVIGNGYLPMSSLNALRRDAVKKLSDMICGEPEPERMITQEIVDGHERPSGAASEAPLSYKRVRTIEQALKADADMIGIDPAMPDALNVSELREIGAKLILILPNVLMTAGAEKAYERLVATGIFSGIEINNISHWSMGADMGIRIAGAGMNIMNGAAASKVLESGFTAFMPSLELTRHQLKALSERFGNAMIVNTYGRAPLMQLMHCPMKEYRGCRKCRGQVGTLSDGDGRQFPLENVRFSDGYCVVRMLNSATTDIRETFKASGIGVFATAETYTFTADTQITRGHWTRAVD